MATDRSIYKSVIVGHIKDTDVVNAVQVSKDVSSHLYTVLDSGLATAATGVAEQVVANPRRAGQLNTVYLTPSVNVTSNDTDYKTITIAKRTGNGSATTIATANTKTTGIGNMVRYVPYAVTVNAANASYAANDVITIVIAASGNGVALGAATAAASIHVDTEDT